jgi:hypothetical protein
MLRQWMKDDRRRVKERPLGNYSVVEIRYFKIPQRRTGLSTSFFYI